MNRTPQRILASVLAIVVIAPGCGISGNDTAQHSVRAVRRCLHHQGIRAAIEPLHHGDFNLLDIRGTIIARLGAARVTIDVSGDGGNIAEYTPNGAAAPGKLVEAVWACAGHGVTTTPYSCSNDGCTSSY